MKHAGFGSALILAAVLAAGCSGGQKQPPTPAAGSTASANGTQKLQGIVNETVGYVKNGVYVDKSGKPLCPVMGHQVIDVKDADHKTVDGVTYYFCCDSCPKEFANHTKAYVFKGKVVKGNSVVQPPMTDGQSAS